jgi:hypothetical protein
MADGDAERTRLANERTYREGREPARDDGAVLVLAANGVAAGIASILLVVIAP